MQASSEYSGDVRSLAGGMILNIALTVCKFLIGSSTHCSALTADGFKDLADAARTGLKLGLKRLRTDVKDRTEPLTAAVGLEKLLIFAVFVLIVIMGVQSLAGIWRDILDQHETNYTPALFIITSLSAALKGYIAYHRRRLGRRRHDEGMIREGWWAAVDSTVSGLILLAAILDKTLHVDIDPWIGFVIACLIIAFAIGTIRHQLKLRQAQN